MLPGVPDGVPTALGDGGYDGGGSGYILLRLLAGVAGTGTCVGDLTGVPGTGICVGDLGDTEAGTVLGVIGNIGVGGLPAAGATGTVKPTALVAAAAAATLLAPAAAPAAPRPTPRAIEAP